MSDTIEAPASHIEVENQLKDLGLEGAEFAQAIDKPSVILSVRFNFGHGKNLIQQVHDLKEKILNSNAVQRRFEENLAPVREIEKERDKLLKYKHFIDTFKELFGVKR